MLKFVTLVLRLYHGIFSLGIAVLHGRHGQGNVHGGYRILETTGSSVKSETLKDLDIQSLFIFPRRYSRYSMTWA